MTFIITDRRQGYEFCSHGDLRLVGGPSQYEGIVEVCFNEVWGTVCTTDDEDLHTYFTAIDANVVCRQLGHQAVGKLLLIVHILFLK